MGVSSGDLVTVGGPGAPVAATVEIAARKIEGRSPWRLAMERLRRDRAAMLSVGVIALIVLVAIFAPVFASLTGHGVYQQFNTIGRTPEGQPLGPNSTFLLGTDELGRDILVRIAYGARISLFVGVVATALTVAVATVVGLAAGYFGKIVDTVLTRLMDVLLAFPFLLLAIALVSVFSPSLTIVIVVIAFFSWASVARAASMYSFSLMERT